MLFAFPHALATPSLATPLLRLRLIAGRTLWPPESVVPPGTSESQYPACLDIDGVGIETTYCTSSPPSIRPQPAKRDGQRHFDTAGYCGTLAGTDDYRQRATAV
jgi:hypothetical protein